MFVNDCMTRHPIMIQADMLASEAQRLMAENGIRHLPVIGQGKKLVGLVTRSSFSISPDVLGSLNVWDISRRLSNVKVADMMVPGRKVITTHPDRTVERAAAIINEHRIGCLPVIDGDIVIGIITEADLMNALQQMVKTATGIGVFMVLLGFILIAVSIFVFFNISIKTTIILND